MYGTHPIWQNQLVLISYVVTFLTSPFMFQLKLEMQSNLVITKSQFDSQLHLAPNLEFPPPRFGWLQPMLPNAELI